MKSPNWDGSKFENYEPILNIVKHSEDDEEDMWGGFVIQSGGKQIYYTGDGGVGNHFAAIAERFPGGMDLVMLENGQYDANWHDVHRSGQGKIWHSGQGRICSDKFY